jgi:hypothetical protein
VSCTCCGCSVVLERVASAASHYGTKPALRGRSGMWRWKIRGEASLARLAMGSGALRLAKVPRSGKKRNCYPTFSFLGQSSEKACSSITLGYAAVCDTGFLIARRCSTEDVVSLPGCNKSLQAKSNRFPSAMRPGHVRHRRCSTDLTKITCYCLLPTTSGNISLFKIPATALPFPNLAPRCSRSQRNAL